ncbi:MAG TPA: cytochrome c family protein [Acetobacteraceae bacterium]|nr:cytochrome c family protein [Acetobacteraceae bacterium]
MDSMEINKVFAAVLTAGIAFGVAGLIADITVHPEHPEKSVLKIESGPAPAAQPEAPKPLAPIGPLLASADPAAGEATTKKLCAACHNFNEGGAAKVGPDLYGVIGRARASVAGFSYSSALQGKSGPWTYEDLNQWLHSPRDFAPGTKMSFAGIDNDKQRADVIAYLRTLSHTPEPLPAAEAPAAAPASPASPATPAAKP